MSKLKPVNLENFTLQNVKISVKNLECAFLEKRVVEGKPAIIKHTIEADYMPHPDLMRLKEELREYLLKAYHLRGGYDLAIQYLKGAQKKIAQDAVLDIYNKVEVTKISIGGDDQLRGVVISGKIESNNKAKCAMNTPRIVFSSDKLGYESDVEEQVELIEREVYKYIFEGKKAQQDLFDDGKGTDQGAVPKSKAKKPEGVLA